MSQLPIDGARSAGSVSPRNSRDSLNRRSTSQASQLRKDRLSLLVLLLPALVTFLLVLAYPIVSAFYYSFTDWRDIANVRNWVGLQNYIRAFQDDRFLRSIGTTMRFSVLYVVISNTLAITLAITVNAMRRGREAARGILFLPSALSMVLVALSADFLFTSGYDQLLESLALSGSVFDVSWFGDDGAALAVTVITLSWKTIGYYVVIYLAGLSSIDVQYMDAADIEGAVGLKRLWLVTLPLMMPAVTVCLFMSIGISMKQFEVFFLLTQGGPAGATEVIGLNIYNEAFIAGRMGFGAAKGIILLVIVLAITAVQFRVTKSRELDG